MPTATRTGRALRALRLPAILAALLLVVPSALAQIGGELRAEGPIVALTDSSLTVGPRTFAVTSMTRITDDDDRPILFSALTVGTDVEVEGRLLANGRALALTIEVEDDDGGDPPNGIRAEGLVLVRTATSLTVGGLTFGVTATTRVRSEYGPATYADVRVGTRVEVRGMRTVAGALVAIDIEIEDRPATPGPGGGHGGGHGGLRVEGLIQTVSAGSLTVRNRTFAITDSTVIVGEGRQPFPAESLAVGLRVEVSGRLLADGTLVARMIEVEDDEDDNELRLRGAIEALTATGLTVSGRTIGVTAQTAVFGADRRPIAFSALVVGQTVGVHATVGAAGALTATRITVEGHGTFEQEVRVRAALGATGDSLVVVLGRPFAVRRFTRILGLNRTPVALASLPVGGLVEIRARRDADGQLVAFVIAAENGLATSVSLTAVVTAVSADALSVLGVPFRAAGAVVVSRTGAPATLADVAVGQTVRLTGTAAATGFTATRIEIRRAARAAGRVASAQGGQITLAGVAVATTTETLFVMEDGTATTAAAAAAGTNLLVSGTVTATGMLEASQVVVLAASRTTATDAAPAGLAIARVFPNPTTGSATLRYAVATAAAVRVTVLDVLGRTVLTATDGPAAAGDHEVLLDTAALPAGVYVVRLSVDGQAAGTRTLTVVR